MNRKTIRWVIAVAIVGFGMIVILSLYRSGEFADQQSMFIRSFLHEYSRQWDVAPVKDRVSKSFLVDLRSSQGQAVRNVLVDLGRIRNVTKITLEHYQKLKQEEVGVFSLDVQFERSKAILRIVIRRKDGKSLVDTLTVKAVENPAGPS